ncbi:hypothetical protein K461DRAFT_320181 [Myriangium duriaei CBS 260.36]|uniref:DNA recombination and repair protein Rad51-like C-terminal domain-containing protein n=1 Tax=Myriangium duriaei CBS 260.36 TaxID=1168546 RepID=A0A9P4J2L3_9PEZI|nr:hypothetical protein K461DRAFT_320181 [Myriangium duriaei CBS 260.36]
MMAAPVEPVLASALWRAHQAKPVLNSSHVTSLLLTACRSVDDAILGGLEYGQGGICVASCESDAGGKQFLNAFLISHLLNTSGNATIIDSQGLNIPALFTSIKAKLSLHPHTNPNLPPRDLDGQAKSILARVKIMRVFDVDGLLEALSELRSSLEDDGRELSAEHSPHTGPKSTVPDSQISDNSEDEDLLATASGPGLGQAEQRIPCHQRPSPKGGTTDHPEQSRACSFVMLDDLSSLLLPIQRNDPTRASALLTNLLRSLRHLTHAHDLAVIIANSTLSMTAGSPRRKPQHPPSDHGPPLAATKATPMTSPSIFASCTARPAFAKIMDSADVHLLIHRVPKTADDARAVYGLPSTATQEEKSAGGEGNRVVAPGRGREGGKRRRDAEWVSCVEVLSDRHGARKGRFGFFGVDAKGRIRDGL